MGLVEPINEAQAQRTALRNELENLPVTGLVTDAEVYAMVDALGDVGAALGEAGTEGLSELYKRVDLQVRYEHEANAADVTIEPAMRVNSECVRGGT